MFLAGSTRYTFVLFPNPFNSPHISFSFPVFNILDYFSPLWALSFWVAPQYRLLTSVWVKRHLESPTDITYPFSRPFFLLGLSLGFRTSTWIELSKTCALDLTFSSPAWTSFIIAWIKLHWPNNCTMVSGLVTVSENSFIICVCFDGT